MPNIEEMIDQIREIAEDIRLDGMRFDEGNNSAGQRVRKSLQQIRKIAHQARMKIQEVRRRRGTIPYVKVKDRK